MVIVLPQPCSPTIKCKPYVLNSLGLFADKSRIKVFGKSIRIVFKRLGFLYICVSSGGKELNSFLKYILYAKSNKQNRMTKNATGVKRIKSNL